MKDDPTEAPGRLQVTSLTLLAQQEIERLITIGALTPGERLNENALANQLGISRGPIREACRALAVQGLVQLIPNRGVFIRTLSEEDAGAVYELRAGIFGYAGMLLTTRLDTTQIAHLEELVAEMQAAAQAQDFDRYYPLNLEFHDYLVTATGNPRLVETYRDLVRQLHLFRTRGLLTYHGMGDSNAEHQVIVDALKSRDPNRAFEAMSGHVLTARDRTLSKAADETAGN